MCRAEAKIFLGDYAGAVADLKTWELTLRSTANDDGDEDRYADLTQQRIQEFYIDKDPGFGIAKPIHIDEVFPVADYSVTDANVALLQCVQHFRRIVTVHNGMRFFDLKRYGIEYSHVIGKESHVETMTMLDPRKALQIPNEVISAGLEPNDRIKHTAGSGEELVADEKYELVK